MTKVIDYAEFYAGRGWRVFPVKPRDKKPLVDGWPQQASSNVDDIRRMFAQYPGANIGIATGSGSGIVVLDVDAGHGGEESLLNLVHEHGRLPDTPESLTGGGGRHIIFNHPGVMIRNSAGKLGPGLDIRGDGGYIVAPPSIHPNGNSYLWEETSKPSKTPVAYPPKWLLEILLANESRRNGNEHHEPLDLEEDDIIPDGQRNDTLASLAGTMRRRGFTTDAIYAALWSENNERCRPPLSADEVLAIAKSVSKYKPTARPAYSQKEEIKYRKPLTAGEGIVQFLDLLEHIDERSIPTSIPMFDKNTGGLERQTLSVLAARPSMGKTTLGWQIARSVAHTSRVFFYSLEVSAASLWAKAVCGALGIRWVDVRNGVIADDQRELIVAKAQEMMSMYGDRLLVDDGVNTTETIWQGAELYRPDLIVVDHIRLVADRGDSEVKRLGEITKVMKEIAKAFNCGFLCLAQLNRGVEGRDNKRPQLSDLRDSGEIEENADMILMMYRDDYYNKPSDYSPLSPTELLIRKFRDDVANQVIKLRFDTRRQWFTDDMR